MKKWQIAVVAVVVIAVGVGAFFGGRAAGGGNEATLGADGQTLLQPGANGTPPQGMQGSDGTGGNGMSGGLGNLISGSILSADESSITIQTSDGGTKIVLLADSTQISKTEEGSTSDLATGEEVVVTGATNDDGTVTATGIQLGTGLLRGGRPSSDGGATTSTTSAQ